MKTAIITLSPTPDNRAWEGCINSVNYRIERGVPVEVPASIANLIRASEAEKRLSAKRLSAFTTAQGMKL